MEDLLEIFDFCALVGLLVGGIIGLTAIGILWGMHLTKWFGDLGGAMSLGLSISLLGLGWLKIRGESL